MHLLQENMNAKKIKGNKCIVALIVIVALVVLLEIFAFNFSTWYSKGVTPVMVASDVSTDDNWLYYTDTYTIDAEVRNVNVKAFAEPYDLAYVSVIMTDDGDKYEYVTPEYSVYNGVERSGFNNVYPFGKVHTIQVKVRAEEGCGVNISSIVINDSIPLNIKPLRMLLMFALLMFGYLVFTNSKLHEVYFDEKRLWQWCVTAVMILVLMYVGVSLAKSDKLLMISPWPHHRQYQELAHSLKAGTVELTNQYVDPALLEVDNPYDTIALSAENIQYSMDYAFYNGKYYAYFGIVPEVLFYYPYLLIKGEDLQNYQVMMLLSIMLVVAIFWLVSGLIRKYAKSVPYFFYLLLCVATTLSANFVYLMGRPDIYNVPILAATVFTLLGLAGLIEAIVNGKTWVKRCSLGVGALSLALVAGCRPQLLILSGIALLWLFCEDGWKKRKLFTKSSIVETVIFVAPYLIVAILVCWYNFARFGNVFDFGATYSLTSNDMNSRGFNMNRLLRSLYCYMLQPAVINTDFPFLQASFSGGNYMGKFLYEYTYGGILVANAFLVSIWIGLVSGFKKIKKDAKCLIIYLIVSAIIIGAFDANSAGVLYRYTCDFAPAMIVAALVLWIVFLDKSQNAINYHIAAKAVYACAILALGYALLTFVASGGSICLENDNRQVFYEIADYFRF